MIACEGIGAAQGELAGSHIVAAGNIGGVSEAECVACHRAGDGDSGPGDLGVIDIGKCEAGLDGGGGGGLGVGKAAAGGDDWGIVDRVQRHPDLDRCAGGQGPVPGFHGERVGGAVVVGGRRPDQGFASGQEGGAGGDRGLALGEGTGGQRLDTEGQGIIFQIGLIGRRCQVGVADGVGGVLGATGEVADGGEGGGIVRTGDGDSQHGDVGIGAVVGSVIERFGEGGARGQGLDRGVVLIHLVGEAAIAVQREGAISTHQRRAHSACGARALDTAQPDAGHREGRGVGEIVDIVGKHIAGGVATAGGVRGASGFAGRTGVISGTHAQNTDSDSVGRGGKSGAAACGAGIGRAASLIPRTQSEDGGPGTDEIGNR